MDVWVFEATKSVAVVMFPVAKKFFAAPINQILRFALL
jgi:hypothetical protein